MFKINSKNQLMRFNKFESKFLYNKYNLKRKLYFKLNHTIIKFMNTF